MISLPVLNCDDCGKCCMEQGSPPGYLLFLACPEMAEGWPDKEDKDRFHGMPDEAKRLLLEYARAIDDNIGPREGPCIWLDLATKQCRFYDSRPEICRQLKVGDEDCLRWRE